MSTTRAESLLLHRVFAKSLSLMLGSRFWLSQSRERLIESDEQTSPIPIDCANVYLCDLAEREAFGPHSVHTNTDFCHCEGEP
jgi:hypothetical protein